MYIGRFVVLGRTPNGDRFLGYRVSSRSFPDRQIVTRGDRAVVLPTADAAPSDNPYIAYNCLRSHDGAAVVANGSHVDPIIDKIAAGYPLRDALALSLLALDYEHDDYNTPRIAAGWQDDAGYLGIVTPHKVLVHGLTLNSGEARLIATYEITGPEPIDCPGSTASDIARSLWDAPFDHPVASLGIVFADPLEIATRHPATQ